MAARMVDGGDGLRSSASEEAEERAGVGAGDDFGGHRSSAKVELVARGIGEVRGVHGWA